ncbi:MAG: sn-glycerol-1-phosphate dehydrogenase [Christensenellaceae bacterium]|nr:sn-glycerol-1-phosphate dehydrogenase [Christensenellaceae bacterium]
MNDFAHMSLEELIREGGYDCECGRRHATGLKYVKICRDAVSFLPEAMAKIGVKKPFIACDRNTKAAAWAKVEKVLTEAGIPYQLFCFDQPHVDPDEQAVGALCMAIDPSCDCVLAVGSGVINDCCKVLSHAIGCPQMVVGTAPSMDGYASNSSSMIQNRVKVTLYNACPDVILADTEIMKDAPERMLWAGLGDMLAKYIALCEWRISHLVTGEYYCEAVAALMRSSLRKIVSAAPRLMERDPEVIGAVAEGLILSGMAMAFAQVSRPASGLEHYFSHLWEMFALDRGLPLELHGIQVGVGTYLTLRIYDRLRKITPSREQAEAAMRAFDPAAWEQNVRRVFGKAAQTLIDSENHLWHKNDPAAHQQRLDVILAHWDDILRIIDEELPETDSIIALMEKVGMPVHPAEIDESEQDTYDAFLASRDIRDKYLTSSLLWDLGLLDGFPLDL